ncbi:unnamed protein product [Brassicogethes aeneus]|uniref:Tubulin-specific chaperone A n=1 Tax=Brassicogethes aeneus TaxID=1431903 RepID=A0A9P0AQ36_BRAAE|nr:unnamed protein product [Brassicogethes aeneus]
MKDKDVYEQEVQLQKVRIEKLKRDGTNERVLSQEEQVLVETKTMIPDTKRRLIKATDDLKKFMSDNSAYSDTNEYRDAKKILLQAKDYLPAPGEAVHMC